VIDNAIAFADLCIGTEVCFVAEERTDRASAMSLLYKLDIHSSSVFGVYWKRNGSSKEAARVMSAIHYSEVS